MVIADVVVSMTDVPVPQRDDASSLGTLLQGLGFAVVVFVVSGFAMQYRVSPLRRERWRQDRGGATAGQLRMFVWCWDHRRVLLALAAGLFALGLVQDHV